MGLVLLNFPISLYELFLGSAVGSYWIAMLITFYFKTIACIIIFILARYIIKGIIMDYISGTKLFTAIERAL